jgi:diacylglycerol kinase family enzyme
MPDVTNLHRKEPDPVKLTVLYANARGKVLARAVLHRHQVRWVKVGQPIPRTPLIIAAGGDGTINYAVNHIDLDQTRLAVLPLGRGNAFARIFNLPFFAFSPRQLAGVEELDLPLLEANGQLAVFGAGMGKGSELIEYAKPYSRLGASSYAAGALKTLQTPATSRLRINDRWYPGVLTAEVSLWGRIGLGLPLTRERAPGPYLTIIRGRPLQAAVKLLSGQVPGWDGAMTMRGDRFLLESDLDVPAHIDGETFYTRRLLVSLASKRVRLIRPRGNVPTRPV